MQNETSLKTVWCLLGFTTDESLFVVIKLISGDAFERTVCDANVHKSCEVDGNACNAREYDANLWHGGIRPGLALA